MNINLGDRARDEITGYTGIATGKVSYITGCDQYQLSASINDRGDTPEARWFDETRLKVLDALAFVQPAALQNGADKPASIK